MTVSMKDIATVAGVSLSTVSRALADSPRVKVDTRRHIQRLAREMGYEPSAIARGLATKRTYSLGVVVLDITDTFIAELVRAVDRVALDHGYSLILSHCGGDSHREMAAIRLLRQQRVDAVLVSDPCTAEASLRLLEASGIPVILINRPSYRYSVCTDNAQAARLAVEHLLGLGHERIAYIGWARHEEENRQRLAGYEQALAAAGLAPDPQLMVDGDGWPSGGQQAMRGLLDRQCAFTAAFCFNDLTAVGAMTAAESAGLQVPRDLSVVGVDNIHLAAHVYPALTTVAQQKDEMARLAVEMALSLSLGDDPPASRPLPGVLMVRSSTDRPGH